MQSDLVWLAIVKQETTNMVPLNIVNIDPQPIYLRVNAVARHPANHFAPRCGTAGQWEMCEEDTNGGYARE